MMKLKSSVLGIIVVGSACSLSWAEEAVKPKVRAPASRGEFLCDYRRPMEVEEGLKKYCDPNKPFSMSTVTYTNGETIHFCCISK